VRRDVGRHPHRDAGGAVDQQIGNLGGKDQRHRAGFVVVRSVFDGLLVEVGEHLLGDCRHAHFRVSLGRGRVAVDRSEVTLTVDEWITE